MKVNGKVFSLAGMQGSVRVMTGERGTIVLGESETGTAVAVAVPETNQQELVFSVPFAEMPKVFKGEVNLQFEQLSDCIRVTVNDDVKFDSAYLGEAEAEEVLRMGKILDVLAGRAVGQVTDSPVTAMAPEDLYALYKTAKEVKANVVRVKSVSYTTDAGDNFTYSVAQVAGFEENVVVFLNVLGSRSFVEPNFIGKWMQGEGIEVPNLEDLFDETPKASHKAPRNADDFMDMIDTIEVPTTGALAE